jgi:hypothetical protein
MLLSKQENAQHQHTASSSLWKNPKSCVRVMMFFTMMKRGNDTVFVGLPIARSTKAKRDGLLLYLVVLSNTQAPTFGLKRSFLWSQLQRNTTSLVEEDTCLPRCLHFLGRNPFQFEIAWMWDMRGRRKASLILVVLRV